MISISVTDDQREIKEHGTFEFPVAVYHYSMKDYALGTINWHWHEEIQLTLVTRGSVCFYADGRRYEIHKGDGFFINSGRLHMAREEGEEGASYLCLDFHPRLITSYPGSIFAEKYVNPYLEGGQLSHLKLESKKASHRAVLDRLREIGMLYDIKAFGYEMSIQAKIHLLWLSLITLQRPGDEQARALPQGHDTVQEIITFLRTHYRETVSLSDVGRAVGFSESECCRQFKQVTGDTILNYLKSYRLSRSIELLENTRLSIGEIAYESGFSGASYYIESFKKELHKTPLQYRKEHSMFTNSRYNPGGIG